MDFQNRVGSKPGAGQITATQAAIARRERLRKLAAETMDVSKDPYIMKNAMGSYECKLCLTLHPNEGSYLSHTQGKKHQTHLQRRAAQQEKEGPQKDASALLTAMEAKRLQQQQQVMARRQVTKIGRPGYKVTKIRDPETGQYGLFFQVHYPQMGKDVKKPLHRFMSAFEQRREPPHRAYQYLLFACAPYETIAFKIQSRDVDRAPGRFWVHFDQDVKVYSLQLLFKTDPTARMQ
jgi:splicing factor 3A subunit 2